MMSNICYLLVTLIALTSIVDCATKLPSSMSQHQYCHGCMATMKELLRKVPKNLKGSRDVAVVDALEKICSPSNFVEYHYSPPKTVKACQLLLENNEDEIETALTKNKGGDIVALICSEVTDACNGVDLNKDSKDAKFADIDLTNDDDGATSKSVNIDPTTGKVVKEGKKKDNDGKTLSKSSKKKKQKKKKKGESGKSTKKSKEKETVSGGKQKGAIHNLNIDINDPDSVKKVMDQINTLTGKYNAEEDGKDEL